MAKKNIPIKYTSRDFASIKQDLVNYAQRYYADSFRDFNEAGFGALMLDTVAYVGDILSFYLDYQTNESFLDTAIEYDNVTRLASQLGYKLQLNPTSYGIVSLFVLVPAASSGPGPDSKYFPILRKGSSFSALNGGMFLLTEDVNFASSNHETVVARVDPSSGVPTFYAVKARAKVMSGELIRTTFEVGAHQRFLTLEVPATNVAEITSIVDLEGHRYFEVEHLSQDIIYAEVPNRISNIDTVKSIIKPVSVPRRFVTINTSTGMKIQFGYGSEAEIKKNSIVDPSNVVLKQYARDYTTDRTFDPSRLNQTDKFGVVPSNTTLYVTYRGNGVVNTNVSANSLNTVVQPAFEFNDRASLNSETIRAVIGSLEVNNTDPIVGDVSLPTSREIKKRAKDFFATQSRAVTKTDYVAYIYNMPEKFGTIKRANIIPDSDSFKRNLNLYVVSESSDGSLAASNSLIKQNLKTWLNKNKMVHDTIDILDAKIINLGIDYVLLADDRASKFDLVKGVTSALRTELLAVLPDIGEAFDISTVYSIINSVPGVVDAVDVEIVLKRGTNYSNLYYDIPANLSPDGRLVTFPEDYIWEIKLPFSDIRGSVQ
jgi:hypothetical protein